jgi:hypothetical protein
MQRFLRCSALHQLVSALCPRDWKLGNKTQQGFKVNKESSMFDEKYLIKAHRDAANRT